MLLAGNPSELRLKIERYQEIDTHVAPLSSAKTAEQKLQEVLGHEGQAAGGSAGTTAHQAGRNRGCCLFASIYCIDFLEGAYS